MTDPTNRRADPRAEPTVGSSTISFLGGTYPIKNISASGILVFPYTGPSTIGQFLQVEIAIKDSGFDFVFRAEATVVRVDPGSVGIRFHAISPDGKDKLARYFSAKFSHNLFDVKA